MHQGGAAQVVEAVRRENGSSRLEPCGLLEVYTAVLLQKLQRVTALGQGQLFITSVAVKHGKHGKLHAAGLMQQQVSYGHVAMKQHLPLV